jgi:DNA polymerase-3 subunit delta
MFYIFHGEDEFSRSEFLEELKRKMGEQGGALLNTTVIDGRKATLLEIKQASDAFPLLGERRLVIIEGLIERSENEKLDLKEIVEYLENLPETTRLIFVEGKSISKDNPILKLASQSKHGFVREFKKPRGKKLSRWIVERARRKGGRIGLRAADELAAFVGADLRLLDQEIDKLISYVNGARPIREEDIRLLVSYTREANVFEMVDALGKKEKGRAVKLLHRLLEEGEHPLALFGMVIRQFRIMLQVKELAKYGFPRQAIVKRLGLHRFVVEKGLEQARNFSIEQLEAIYNKLLETDVAIKTGRIDAVLALDTLIIGLCSEEGL